MRTELGHIAAIFILLASLACSGGDSPTAPSPASIPVPTPASAPAAAITATLAGPLVLHPAPLESWSGETRAFVLDVPLRIQETGGGSADWHYARLQLFSSGGGDQGVLLPRLLEVSELGSPALAAAGFSRIEPGSTTSALLPFRCNAAGDFDVWELRLGFGDVATGAAFVVEVTPAAS